MTGLERIAAAIARVFPRAVRLWLYGIGVAAFGVLLVYQLVNLEQAGAWLALVGAALGLGESGMAALNARRGSTVVREEVPGGILEFDASRITEAEKNEFMARWHAAQESAHVLRRLE